MASINLQGDTSGSISISAPSVAGTNTLTLPATTQTLATQNALGVRNLIINGDMKIAQRGTSVSGITGGGYHTVDRFYNNITSAGTWTSSQDTDVPTGQGFAKSHKLTCTATASPVVLAMIQNIEGQMLQHLKKGTANAESLTLSFWVKSNKTGTYINELYDTDNTRQISKSYTINSADTWEKKIITFEGDTTGTINNDNTTGLQLYWWLGASSTFTGGTLNTSWASDTAANRAVGVVNLADTIGNYINITGVQLEVGDTATPFEHRPYDMELRRCLRYYYKNIGNGAGTGPYGMGHCRSNYLRGQLWLPVTMRATPTMTNTGTDVDYIVTSGTSDFTSFVTRPSLDGGGPDGLNFRVQVASGMTNGNAALLYLNSSNSYLEFSAEL